MTNRITIFGAELKDLPLIATAIGIAANERPRGSSEVVVLNRSLGNKALVKFTRAGVSVRFEKETAHD